MATAGGKGSAQQTDVRAAQRVFVSYASADTDLAHRLVADLERRGICCWFAPRDVLPGAQYADAIVRAISESPVFLVLLSTHAIASAHVGREVERAGSKRRRMLALRVDSTPLTPALEYFLGESQWVELHDGEGAAVSRLAEAILRDTGPGIGTQPPVAPKKRTRQTTTVFAVIAVAIAVLLGAGLLANKWRVPSTGRSGSTSTAAFDVGVRPSIAVLAFEDRSEKQDQQYLARGIAEEVLGRLAKIPGLKVIGRSSSFQYDSRSADPRSIGKALGATYLLEGTVRPDGDRVKVNAEMVSTADGSLRWSDAFDIKVVNVGQMQDTIAAGLARALQISLDLEADVQRGQVSAKAYDFYLRGLQALNQGSQSSSADAVADFQQALALEPSFAAAAVGLGKAYVWIGQEAWQPPRDAFTHARAAAELALKIEPKNARAYVVRAEIRRIYDWDWEGSRKDLDSAFELAPRETDGLQSAAMLASALGDWIGARELATEALALDPLDYAVHELIADYIAIPTARYAEAEQELRTAAQFSPHAGNLHDWLGKSLLLQKRYDEALTAFSQETRDDGQLEGSAMVYFAQGKRKQADQMLAEAAAHSGALWASEIARVHAYRGEVEQALRWLERAYEQRDEDLWFIKADPFLRNLAAEPRFQALLRKMNLPVDPTP